MRRERVNYSYEVVDIVSSRQPAKNVPLYCRDITPQEELDKLHAPHETIFVFRDRGTGRPTKKERREIDSLIGGLHVRGGGLSLRYTAMTTARVVIDMTAQSTTPKISGRMPTLRTTASDNPQPIRNKVMHNTLRETSTIAPVACSGMPV